MNSIDKAGTFRLGSRDVKRIGYGAMQLAGPGIWGPPKDPDGAVAVLRALLGLVELGAGAVADRFCGGLEQSAHPYFATLAGLRVSAHLLVKAAMHLARVEQGPPS